MQAWQTEQLGEAAARVAAVLAERQLRLVMAESCTGGLAAAALATIPGISQWFCGSAVTYREQTKIDWLAVSADDLAELSAVSSLIAAEMTQGALVATREADVAVAITGHLGPAAPADLDGIIWIGSARRCTPFAKAHTESMHLTAVERQARQAEAATQLLRHAAKWISGMR
jgi:PncC family amidohydrolase